MAVAPRPALRADGPSAVLSRRDEQVEQVRMDKSEFYRAYDGPDPALVFLDAVHTYEETKLDIQWARRVRASIICGHDYCKRFPGVIRAVDEFGRPAQLRGSLWSL